MLLLLPPECTTVGAVAGDDCWTAFNALLPAAPKAAMKAAGPVCWPQVVLVASAVLVVEAEQAEKQARRSLLLISTG